MSGTRSYNPYGKQGTFARSENFRNTGGTLDGRTLDELWAYANNTAGQFDEETAHKAALELLQWGLLKEEKNGVVPINGNSYSNSRYAYDTQLKAIEEQRKYQEQLAEQGRQEAIKNAYLNYDRSLPTYGQNAERLANMGLSNSGYSDYLGGVAYSSMVGGVQDAHKTANEAIRDAYYNAELQKAEAANMLYDRQLTENQIAYDRQIKEGQIAYDRAQDKAEIDAETKAAYDYALSGIIAGAGNGTYNEETALGLAYANGITNEADIQKIKDVANAYLVDKTKKDEETAAIQKEEALKEIAIAVSATDEYGNYPTEEAVKNAYSGILSDEEMQEHLKTLKENTDNAIYNEYVSQITAATTDSEINSWTDDPTMRDKLKVKRDEIKSLTDLETTLLDIKTNGATTETIETADNLISIGKKELGQQIYFENDLALIQNIGNNNLSIEEVMETLEEHRGNRLSEDDYNNLLKYLYAKYSGEIDSDKIKKKFFGNKVFTRLLGLAGGRLLGLASLPIQVYALVNDTKGKHANVVIDDEKYKVNIDDTIKITEEQQSSLSAEAGKGNVVRDKENNYYIKVEGKWYKVKESRTDDDFFEAVNKNISTNNLISPPKYDQKDYMSGQ